MIQVTDDSGEVLLGLLMEVRDRDTRGENGIVRVLGGEVCSRFGSKVLRGPLPHDAKRVHESLTSSSTVVTPW